MGWSKKPKPREPKTSLVINRPCPNCDGAGGKLLIVPNDHGGKDTVWVVCPQCG